MTAQIQTMTSEHSAFDSVSSWLQGQDDPATTDSGSARIVTDIKILYQRVSVIRKVSPSLAGVELSPYVKNMVKMVGAMEIIEPPSLRSLS